VRHRKLANNRTPARETLLSARSLRVVDEDYATRFANAIKWPKRMYAIAFDLQTEILRNTYPTPVSWRNAYDDIRKVLADYGFEGQQGSVYFGDAEKATPVQCVLAVQELTRRYPWFAGAVGDIRMLRIEENNDLMPAIDEIRHIMNAHRTVADNDQPVRPGSRLHT
jgi:virulence-associated protein VapD